MKQQERKDKPVSRRSFLRIAGLSAGAAGAAATGLAATAEEAKASETAGHDPSGYRETDHVKAYYRLAQF